MEWAESIRKAIAYMEAHIREDISPGDVAGAVNLSPFYFQRGFEVMTGYSVARYLRCRRLYLAALDLAAGKGKVIDAALRYGFETPEGFAKAFTRFHGATPTQAMADHSLIKPFFPLKITLTVQGGTEMEYKVEKLDSFQVIGFLREISYGSGYQDCPAFWEEFSQRYLTPLFHGKEPETELERAVCEYQIGEYGVCLDDTGKTGVFRYMIAGRYDGGPVPEGLTLYRFPESQWAKFPCRGPMPGALQTVNTQIFQEWLPGNTEYEPSLNANIEWYASEGETTGQDYESAIWLPVREKKG